jgi:hypothetical protein
MKQFFIVPKKFITFCTIKMRLAAKYIVYQLKQKRLSGHSKRHCHAYHPYHCVAIEPEDSHLNPNAEIKIQVSVCACVKKQQGARYLSHSTPHLPLPECDCKHCNCHYKHYDDRRNSVRRSNGETHRQLYLYLNSNDRKSSDRRHKAKFDQR